MPAARAVPAATPRCVATTTNADSSTPTCPGVKGNAQAHAVTAKILRQVETPGCAPTDEKQSHIIATLERLDTRTHQSPSSRRSNGIARFALTLWMTSAIKAAAAANPTTSLGFPPIGKTGNARREMLRMLSDFSIS